MGYPAGAYDRYQLRGGAGICPGDRRRHSDWLAHCFFQFPGANGLPADGRIPGGPEGRAWTAVRACVRLRCAAKGAARAARGLFPHSCRLRSRFRIARCRVVPADALDARQPAADVSQAAGSGRLARHLRRIEGGCDPCGRGRRGRGVHRRGRRSLLFVADRQLQSGYRNRIRVSDPA